MGYSGIVWPQLQRATPRFGPRSTTQQHMTWRIDWQQWFWLEQLHAVQYKSQTVKGNALDNPQGIFLWHIQEIANILYGNFRCDCIRNSKNFLSFFRCFLPPSNTITVNKLLTNSMSSLHLLISKDIAVHYCESATVINYIALIVFNLCS